jgi:hypothetical protein
MHLKNSFPLSQKVLDNEWASRETARPLTGDYYEKREINDTPSCVDARADARGAHHIIGPDHGAEHPLLLALREDKRFAIFVAFP